MITSVQKDPQNVTSFKVMSNAIVLFTWPLMPRLQEEWLFILWKRQVRWMSEFSKRLCWTFWLWRCSCCKPSFCVRFLGFHPQLELASESWLSRTSVNIFWDLWGVVCNGLTCLFVNVPEQSKWESPVHLWRREDDGSQASPSQMRVLGTNFFKLAF